MHGYPKQDGVYTPDKSINDLEDIRASGGLLFGGNKADQREPSRQTIIHRLTELLRPPTPSSAMNVVPKQDGVYTPDKSINDLDDIRASGGLLFGGNKADQREPSRQTIIHRLTELLRPPKPSSAMNAAPKQGGV